MNIFNKIAMDAKPFLDMTGYVFKTTFWQDFGIAETISGTKGVQETFDRAFPEWQGNVEYITELVMVLNWKSWQYAETNQELALLYQELWSQADSWCMDNLKGNDLDYFLSTTD